MLNFLTKTKPWMVASLFVAAAAFGQDDRCPPAPKCQPKPCNPPKVCPCPEPKVALMPAYNAPARIETRCAWDVWADASFIYWQPIQENMELGFASTSEFTPGVGVALSGIKGNFINMDFNYKPGFKVGGGMNFDNDGWDSQVEYTWFHNTHNQKSNGPSGGAILPTWGNPSTMTPTTAPTGFSQNLYNHGAETWRLKLDVAEWDLGRWYYVGKRLTFRPNVGMRAAWIRQHVKTVYTASPASVGSTTSALGGSADVATIHQKSNSWGVGTKLGLDSNWLVGEGFRLFTNAEADVLYTRYTKLRYQETHTETGVTVGSLASKKSKYSQKNLGALRTHLDVNLGLGWGTYFDCNNWHLDFAAGYEFQVFFDQNMFRHYNSDAQTFNSFSPNGNLYVQGLTATVRLDF